VTVAFEVTDSQKEIKLNPKNSEFGWFNQAPPTRFTITASTCEKSYNPKRQKKEVVNAKFPKDYFFFCFLALQTKFMLF
jgi:hypothetical protein